MSALFTLHAAERLKELDFKKDGKGKVGALLSKLNAIRSVSDLKTSPEATYLRSDGTGEVFLIRVGEMRATVYTDPRKPYQLVVISAYEDERNVATADLHAASSVKATAEVR